MTKSVLVDDRQGSKELIPVLKRLGIEAEIERLDSCDFAFTGNGPKGEVLVGIERKTIGDLINSLSTGRLSARQLPAMVQSYSYRWIVVEGLWRSRADSRIEIYKRFSSKVKGEGRIEVGGWYPARTQLSWFQVMGRIVNLEVEGGCWVERTVDIEDTARVIGVLFHWWQKEWKRHRGHLELEKGLTADRVLYSKPSYPRLVANVLPGIGWEKSKAVARHFKTISLMVGAGPEEWAKIPGIGKKLSTILPLIMYGDRKVQRSREE